MFLTKTYIRFAQRFLCAALISTLLLSSEAWGYVLSTSPDWISGTSGLITCTALGDVDRDGDLDLVTGSHGLNKLFLNHNGILSESPAWVSDESNTTYSIALGDMDNDGDLDLVCDCHGRIKLYLNDGRTFSSEPVWSTTYFDYILSSALGDVDGDGDLDIVYGGYHYYEHNYLLLNEGGFFRFGWASKLTYDTYSVVLGDIDGDGDLDLVCGNYEAPNTLYLYNDSTFSSYPDWASELSNNTTSLALGDLDGDGDLDLVCANAEQPNTIYYNDSGRFRSSAAFVSEHDNDTRSVVLGDLDNDADLDIIFGNFNQQNTYYEYDSGRFSRRWLSLPANPTYSVVLGDMNGDGFLDLLCGNYLYFGFQSVTLYGNNSCMISPDVVPIFPYGPTFCMALEDIDNDGDHDLITGGVRWYLGKGNCVYLNEGGVFSSESFWSAGSENSPTCITTGDVNGDLFNDLLFGYNGFRNVLYLNKQTQVDTVPGWYSNPANATASMVFGDIDNDNDLDLICGNDGQPNTLYFNNNHVLDSLPGWTSSPSYNTVSIALEDIDQDNDLDLVCGNRNQPNTLYLNREGVLDTLPSWFSDSEYDTRSIALGDIDGDDDLDLVCGNYNYGEGITLYLCNGTTFSSLPDWTSGGITRTYSIALGDLDGDGDLDLINGTSSEFGAFFMNEGGIFKPHTECNSSGYYTWAAEDVALNDIDADGDLDLIRNSGVVYVHLGLRSPPCKNDPTTPTRHLPNNSAFISSVNVERASRNRYQVYFTAVDIEYDTVWILPEYLFKGLGVWHPVDVIGYQGLVGPFHSSPQGENHFFDWDVSLEPVDRRNVVLRLRVISNPQRTGVIQHIPSYLKEIPALDVERPTISTSAEKIVFQSITVGDTTSAEITITNKGQMPLSIYTITLPSSEMWLDISAPFEIPAGLQVSFTIYAGLINDLDISSELLIESSDPVMPICPISIKATAYPIEFNLLNLYEDGILSETEQLIISLTLEDSVEVDSILCVYGKGGEDLGMSFLLNQVEDQIYLGTLPADSITSRGIEYYVVVYNGSAAIKSELRYLRKEISNLIFPFKIPAEKYRMISIPLDIPNNTIVGVLDDDLKAWDPTQWRMFYYASQQSRYLELPHTDVDEFIPGRAYWLISRNTVFLDTEPLDGLSIPTDSCFTIPLLRGQNMIGNPFNFSVAWDELFVDTLGGNWIPMSEAESVFVEPPVFWRLKGGWQYNIEVLEPFQGYWIKNIRDTLIYLLIPPNEVHEIQNDTPSVITPSQFNWRIEIRAISTGASDCFNFAGITQGATREWDRHDLSEPPSHPGESMCLYFPHHFWSKNPDNYTVDIRDPSIESDLVLPEFTGANEIEWGHVWRFDVAKNYSIENAGDEVRLEFFGIESVPEEATIMIVDYHLDKLINLRLVEQYSFFLKERAFIRNEKETRFALLVGSEQYFDTIKDQLPGCPNATTLYQNYPNPFNPSTIIRYDIAVAEEVSIKIFNATGALVKVLYEGFRDPGRYEIGWNGDNEFKEQVSSGIYFYQLKTKSGYSDTKKMVFLK